MNPNSDPRRSPLARLGRACAAAGHAAMLAQITAWRPGMRAAVSPRWGMHIAAGASADVLAVDLDHGHCGPDWIGHSAACYKPRAVECTLAWGLRPDGNAALRSREPAFTLAVR